MNINASLAPRFCMPSSHTSSMTILPSPFIPPRPSSPRRCRRSTVEILGGAPTIPIPTTAKRSYHHFAILEYHHHNNKYINNKVPAIHTFKNLFLLPNSTVVAFNARISPTTLQDFIFQQSV